MGHGAGSEFEKVGPEGATNVHDYVSRLRLLKVWAGNPSLEQLRLSTGYPRSTLFDALNPKRTGLPALALVRRFVEACGGSPEDVEAWSSVWRRIQAGEVAPPARKESAEQERSEAGSPASSGRAGRPSPVVPRQLPAVSRHFVGRDGELAVLDGLAAAGGDDAGVPIAVITGSAGMGKTALAVHWAHRVADRFPDGHLYVDLRGFGPGAGPVHPAAAARGFLAALGVSDRQIPAGAEERTALYRSLLAGRRMLVVLDNAADADQVRPLLPGSGTCLVLVTSRDRMTGLVASQGARPVRLGPLSESEGHRLLVGHVGRKRASAEPDAVALVVERCGRLPLAVAVAAARAAAEPGLRLTAIAAELGGDRDRLGALRTGDAQTDPRVVLSWSYRRLSGPARRMFRLLGLYSGPDAGVPVAAALAGVTPERARELLAELHEASLVGELGGRYGMHDLIRAYARELVEDTETEADRRAALRRVLDHYLRTALPAASLLRSIGDPIDPPPAEAEVRPERFRDAEQAMEWFGTEHHGLLAAVTDAGAYGFDTHAWQLARVLVTYLDRRGHWQDWVRSHRTALESARRLGDPLVEARIGQLLGNAYVRLGRYDEGRARLADALDLFDACGRPDESAGTHLDLSSLYDRQGDHERALGHAERALALYRAAADEGGMASALNNAGWHQARLGNLRAALDCCREALALFQRLGRTNGTAVTWDSLGDVHHRSGEHEQAIEAYRQAVDLFRGLGDRRQEAEVLVRLGDAYQAAGTPERADEVWRRALSLLDRLGHESAAEVRQRLDRAGGASP